MKSDLREADLKSVQEVTLKQLEAQLNQIEDQIMAIVTLAEFGRQFDDAELGRLIAREMNLFNEIELAKRQFHISSQEHRYQVGPEISV